MEPIVLMLQREAMDDDSRTSDLLRKAFVVARKLKIVEFEDWCNRQVILNSFCSLKLNTFCQGRSRR
ncbi:AbiTii domain-containing protein [Salibacterium qingdaonense]|uniref:AbiTii domain-containing protein n=1 Tax=Salibacterium qingdaonense TaxID=266892 RepID=UPI000B870819